MVLLEAGILELNATLVAQLLTFLLTLAVLYRLAWGPVLRALDARRARIREGLEAAEQAKRERLAAEQEYQAKLEQARKEAQAMVDQATRIGEALRQELEQKARAQAEEIIARARSQIDRERERAVQELRGQVAGLAVLAAARIVGQELDPRKHRELIDRAIEEAELRA